MHPSIRNPLIERLAEAMRVIGMGGTFERFGAVFLDHYLGVPLSHRGLNVLGVPVSREIDTRDEMATQVAEYSAEKSYFSPAMKKPALDIAHALEVHPKAEHIFLLSAQRAPDGRISAFIEEKKKDAALKDKTVHLWDSRRIAEIIIDQLLVSNTAVDALAELLPVLGQIRDELAAGNLVPAPDPKQVSRLDVEAALDGLIITQPCVAIWGIGGSGKSNAAVGLIARVAASYELSVWFKPGEVNSLEDLSAARLVRGGEARNVAALLKNRRCLVVLDDIDPGISIDRLVELCGPNSRIVVTSRAEIPGGYALPLMTEREARTLIDQEVESPCPDAYFEVIWRSVGGHPLSLGLLNKAVIEGASWAEVAADCADIGELSDGDQRLADRVLGRLRATLERELCLFAWAGQSRCDRGFFSYALKPLALRKVEHHGLTTIDDARTTRLHDIVFASLQAQQWLTSERAAAFEQALADYIAELHRRESLRLVALAMTMKPKIEALVQGGDRRAAYLVALLVVWEPEEIKPGLLPDPVEAARSLSEHRVDQLPLEVTAIIEAIEGLWRHEGLALGTERARERYRARLEAFDILRVNPHCTNRQRAEIDHHRAKALNLLGEREEARKAFEAIMAGPSPLAATGLQLIRIYSRTSGMAREAARLAGDILSAPPGTVSATVVLAVVEALPWGQGEWQEELMRDHAQAIERTIIEGAAIGLDQAYQTFASVGRNWVWNAPDRLLKLFNAIPSRSPATIAGDRNRFAYGELLRLVAKAARDPNYEGRALEAFSLLESPNDFQRQQYAQLLIDMDRFTDAVAVLQLVERPNPWSNYHLSRAKLGLGDPGEALRFINDALAALSTNTEKYRSAFLAHRCEVRREQGDQDASQDLDAAIAASKNPKYLRELEVRRNRYIGGL